MRCCDVSVDDRRAERFGERVDVEAAEQLAHGRRADVGDERGVVLFLRLGAEIQVLVFVEQLVDRDFLVARLDDDVVGVIDDLLEITQRDVEEIAHRARQRLEEPDVGDGNGELDVTHALAAHLAQGHFDAATVADHTAIANALVFAAMAFPVLDRTEDALAEQAVLLRLERAVVDRLGLGDFAPRPPVAEPLKLQALALLGVLGSADLFRRSDADLNEVERAGALFAHAAEVNHRLLLVLPLPLPDVPVSMPVPQNPSTLWPIVTLMPSACSSFTSTLNDSGMPGSGRF